LSPRVVSAAEWLAARKELQADEEEAVRALEQIPSRRRDMPAVRIEKDYVFEGPDGRQDETAELLHHDKYPEA
jgi:predicted dithiol-disulfide oxidoreductase (DUF899 family)